MGRGSFRSRYTRLLELRKLRGGLLLRQGSFQQDLAQGPHLVLKLLQPLPWLLPCRQRVLRVGLLLWLAVEVVLLQLLEREGCMLGP